MKIAGSYLKADAPDPLLCEPQWDYEGRVTDETHLLCPLPGPPGGHYGYLIAVCRPDGKCARTDPGIWVNKGGVKPELPTLEQQKNAAEEAKRITPCDVATLQKLSKQAPPKKPAQKSEGPKP